MLIKPLIKNGLLLLIEAIVDNIKFVLTHIYNCNTESQQLLTLPGLHKILQNVDNIGNKNIIVEGDFNFHFNSNVEVKVGKPSLRRNLIIELIESFKLCDI